MTTKADKVTSTPLSDSMQDPISNDENESCELHAIYDEKGKLIGYIHVECMQKDTINRIFQLNRDTDEKIDDFREEIGKRDIKLKESYDDVKGSIDDLSNQLENRKLINNYNKEEKERLARLLEKQGEKNDETEDEVNTYIQRLSNLEGTVKILVVVLPVLMAVFIAINGIALYTLLNHLAMT